MRVVIVGGGTAGWLAALMMVKIRPDHKVTVIESSKIGIIGAGEGSTGSLTNIVQNIMWDLGCIEHDFIKETDSTIKYGIKHKAWSNNLNDYYIAPIDGTSTSGDPTDIQFQFALGHVVKDELHRATELGMNIDFNANTFSEKDGNHTYHFDAHKVGQYFKKLCGKGITLIDSEVDNVQLNSLNGYIEKLTLSNGKIVEGDFFIDATGFARILMNKLDAKWISYKENLPVNSALPFILPYEEDEKIEPVTTAWAQNNGWCWMIPTLHRKGCGYVFSDEFVSADEAHAELEKTIGKKIDPIKLIKFDSGRQEKQWIKNCMSIGLSGAFAEPLEATSIHTTIFQLKDFIFGCIGTTRDNTCNDGQINAFNDRMAHLYDTMKDFLVAHYTCGRNDTEFWKYIDSGATTTPFVSDIHALCKVRVPNSTMFPRMEGSAGWPLWSYILAGTGKLSPETCRKELEFYRDTERAKIFYIQSIRDYENKSQMYKNNTDVIRKQQTL